LKTPVLWAILQFFTVSPILQNCIGLFSLHFGPVAAVVVTLGITARNASAPPIRAAEPLFLPPAVNFCTV
jgi:hypothetical protein